MEKSYKEMNYSNEKVMELYEFWKSSKMTGPITFLGVDEDNRVEIAFYESYEILNRTISRYVYKKFKNIHSRK